MRPQAAFSLDNVAVGESPRMRAIFDLVKVVARSDSSVIITGESGTGMTSKFRPAYAKYG